MSLKTPNESCGLTALQREMHLSILTFLRATDLSNVQQTCTTFNNRELVVSVVDHFAAEVYPRELTEGFDTPIVSPLKSVVVASNKGRKKAESQVTIKTDDSLKVYTFEMLRNMETLVVTRAISRPEPPLNSDGTCFYVSKSWCKSALAWLEVQQEERKERELTQQRAAEEAKLLASTPSKKGKKQGKHPGSSGKKKKLSRKEQRARDRKMSNALPPPPNVNSDLVCEHGCIKNCSSKQARARRRVMDKQAWKILKSFYPDSHELSAEFTGCLICRAEDETAKKAVIDRKEEEKANRKKPLSCPLVRGFYTRASKGFPSHCLVPPKPLPLEMSEIGKVETSHDGFSMFSPIPLQYERTCPLKPGVYCALPRSWCYKWRKYMKNGGDCPPPPDASECLCEAHSLPLVPPHLESFLRGETTTLLGGTSNLPAAPPTSPFASTSLPVGASFSSPSARRTSDSSTLQALRAAGLSESEVHAQRLAMARIEDERIAMVNEARRPRSDSTSSTGQERITNEQLDRENRVVVEILTDDEVTALESLYPRVTGGTYALRFAVIEGCGGQSEIVWTTQPCRECDPSSSSEGCFSMRNRHKIK